jgi:ketosteroid isomerase-like protein
MRWTALFQCTKHVSVGKHTVRELGLTPFRSGSRIATEMTAALIVFLGIIQATPPDFDAERLVARWVAMWNNYDLDLVDELFLTDDRVTYLSSEKEGLIRGIDAVREHHRGFGFVPGGKTPERQLWVEDVDSQSFGDAAVVTAVWFFGSRDRRSEAQHGPMTLVYVKSGKEYRLAHLHFANY